MSSRKTVELFYDVVSPYAWIGFELLHRYRSKWNIDLVLKPFFLGGIMKGSENRPPMMVPAKGAYMIHDIERLRDFYQIPLKHPSDPFDTIVTKGSLASQRLLTAVAQKYPSHLESISRQLWMRIWHRDEDITAPESLRQALKSAGMSAAQSEELLKLSTDRAVADKLKAVTQEALDLGAFGAPIIVAHVNNEKHMFWGSDRIELLAHLLGEKYEGPLREYAASKL